MLLEIEARLVQSNKSMIEFNLPELDHNEITESLLMAGEIDTEA